MILRNFISLRVFTVYMENPMRFDRSEICTEVSFTSPELMWTQIMKLPCTEVKFYPEVKSQTGLSSLQVSCKCALSGSPSIIWNPQTLENGSSSLMQQMSAMNVSTSSQSNFLVNLRKKYFNHLIIGILIINSLPNKFEDLKILVKGKVDIIVINESKLDHTFPDSSFHISGYNKTFRKDRNRNGGGIFVFIRDDIPCKELQVNFFNEFEVLFVEINLSHTKWLFAACCHPPSKKDDLFFRKLSNQIDFYSKTYDNFFYCRGL